MSLKKEKSQIGLRTSTAAKLICRANTLFNSSSSFKGDIAVSLCSQNVSSCVNELDFSSQKSDENLKPVCNERLSSELDRLFSVFTPESLSSLLNDLLSKESMTKSTYTTNDSEKYGFPMSTFLKRIPCQPLTYKSLEIACHFVDDYAQKLLCKS